MTTTTQSDSITLDYVKTIGIVNNGLNGRGYANPYDLAVSGDGRIFVLNRCDPARAAAIRVGVCNLDEDYLYEFGDGAGSGDTQFRWPVCMAFDSNEHLYVTDEQNQRVTVFDSDGNFLRKWGTRGDGDGEFNGPAGIAAGPDGSIYVVEQHNARVQRFTAEGDYVGQWGSHGNGPGQFNLPWGAATDGAGNVYVADWRNDRIQKFTADGEFLAAFGSSGDGEGQFQRPTSVAVDGEGLHIRGRLGQRAGAGSRPGGRLPTVAAGRGHGIQVGPSVFRRQPRGEGGARPLRPDAATAAAPEHPLSRIVAD